MRKLQKYKQHGFSLVEIMLVLVIIGGMIYMGTGYMQTRTRMIQIDRASAQMQQILNAGLSYYVSAGTWPADIATLQTAGYLPSTGVISPWGTNYTVAASSDSAVLTVTISLPAGYASGNTIAKVLAGKLPFGVSTDAVSPGGATVAASVNIPGQNLNNVGTVSFAGVYHNGACVPAPSCPASTSTTTYTPQILVVPVSVSGMSDAGSTQVYPLASITAKAMGEGTSDDPADLSVSGPAACGNDTSLTATACYKNMDSLGTYSNQITSGKYWRVCLFATTAQGDVTWDLTTGEYASVLAITRCGISTETSGSSFEVWAH